MPKTRERKIFIELTNKVHGGIGWEFGTCLWSPTLNKAGQDTWRNMRKPREGDIIIHSYNTSTKSHIIQGFSIVDQKWFKTGVEPEEPGKWGGYEDYYKVNLKNYTEVPRKKPLQGFLDMYSEEIMEHHEKTEIKGTFYDRKLKVAQKYLESVDSKIFNYMLDYLKISNIDSFLNLRSKEDYYDEEFRETIPERKNTVVTRLIRDTKIIKELKDDYENRCQICGERVQIGEKRYYSEGAHIVPLGSPYEGSDSKDNILILCPNHHVAFDYGFLTINHKNEKIEKINNDNITLTRPLVKHTINKKYLKKHNELIYQGKIKE